MQNDQIVIYKTENGETVIDVKLENETIWLTQKLMSELFEKDSDTIGLHIKNILSEAELDEKATTELFSVVQQEGKRSIKRNLKFYNLDMILSVGYRVNSKKGTQFRIWANKILKDHLLKGYSINESRLREQNEQLQSLKSTVTLLSNVLENKSLNNDEATGLLKVVTDYAYALDILDKYDHQELVIEGTTIEELFIIDYAEAKQAIHDLKENSAVVHYSGMKRTNPLKDLLLQSIKRLAAQIYIPAWKKKQPIFYISWLKIIHSLMAINVLQHTFSSGSWKKMASYTEVTAPSDLQIMHWWL